MGFNRVILMGKLTRSPETRFAQSGTAIVKFGLAVNRREKDGEQYVEKTTFVDVTMFGKRAEAFAKFHDKGATALIEGELRLDEWEDKQTGQKRQKLYVVGNGWEFTGGKNEGGGNRSGGGQREEAPPQAAASADAWYDETNPF